MASVDPNLGLSYGWTLGESGWKDGMDANLKRLGAVVGLSVKDRDLGTPPASPARRAATSSDADMPVACPSGAARAPDPLAAPPSSELHAASPSIDAAASTVTSRR